MATLGSAGSGQAVILGTGQSGNTPSTNTAQQARVKAGGVLTVSATAGTTVTVKAQGSMDGTNFYDIALALTTTPITYVASFVMTTTSTVVYILSPDVPWAYLRVDYSANTGMTALAATIYPV